MYLVKNFYLINIHIKFIIWVELRTLESESEREKEI
jgi:hypothetical protein